MELKLHISDSIQLTPSIGRMRHIGQRGLGANEKGTWELNHMTPWDYWKEELANTSSVCPTTATDSSAPPYYYLDPLHVTD
eukprot:7385091-Ditylum_brightwellii.AAC.1